MPCVAFGAVTADLTSNATGGVGREDQDDKEEEIIRQDDRDKGDGIAEETKDRLLNDDEVDGQAKIDSHLEARRQKRTKKVFEKRIEQLNTMLACSRSTSMLLVRLLGMYTSLMVGYRCDGWLLIEECEWSAGGGECE